MGQERKVTGPDLRDFVVICPNGISESERMSAEVLGISVSGGSYVADVRYFNESREVFSVWEARDNSKNTRLKTPW